MRKLLLLVLCVAAQGETLDHLEVAPEHYCSHDEYDRAKYDYDPAKQRELLSKYQPYTDKRPKTREGLQVEHVLALEEAHRSGMCGRSNAAKRRFAQDTLNQTLASPIVNNSKSSMDASQWIPPSKENWEWFAHKIIQVKHKYGLTVDSAEREALEMLLKGLDPLEPAKGETP